MSDEGVVVIKAQRHRSQELNRRDALERLNALVAKAAEVPRVRKPTRPTAGLEAASPRGQGPAVGDQGGARQEAGRLSRGAPRRRRSRRGAIASRQPAATRRSGLAERIGAS